MTSNRKPLPAAICTYACCNCDHKIHAMPYTMESRNFCPACGCSMWKFKGIRERGESSGCGSDRVIDSSFHRPLTNPKSPR